jgi:hypothetical protein
MSVSVVVNTAALGTKSGDILSSGKVPHRARVKVLREVLLPRLCSNPLVDEVIVAGEWHEPGIGDRWRYVPVASQNFDCTDALASRQAGAEASHGNLLVFLHDDHVPGEDFFVNLVSHYGSVGNWDVLVPERRTFKDGVDIALNNGASQGYVMGHACVLRREIWKDVPWTDVPQVHTWDVGFTLLLRQQLAIIKWVRDLVVYDAESALGARPWE